MTTMASYVGSAIGFLVALPVKSKDDVQPLLYWEAGASIVILSLAIIDHYWPALPPLPPSISSAMTHTKVVPIEQGSAGMQQHQQVTKPQSTWQLLKEMMLLLKNGQFMLLTMVYGITAGTLLGWSGVLYPLLTPLGFTQVIFGHSLAILVLSVALFLTYLILCV
jgi:hypothetical protein